MTMIDVLPALPLRGVIVFPYLVINLDVGREYSIRSVENAVAGDNKIVLVAQRFAADDNPTTNEVHQIGVIAEIKQFVKMPNGSLRVLVEGLERVRISELSTIDSQYFASVTSMPMQVNNDVEASALASVAMDQFENWAKLSGKATPEILLALRVVKTPTRIYDFIAGNLHVDIAVKQELLECEVLEKGLNRLIELLSKDTEVLKLAKKIADRVKTQVDKSQKEYYLKEQLKAINKELIETDENLSEIREEYKEKMQGVVLPEHVKEKIDKEIQRLERMPNINVEGSVIRTYLDTLLNVPWLNESKDNMDIVKSEQVLNADHYGLDKVKERIIEYIAVKNLTNSLKGPILCLVGPPGVGKTSLAMSVARALDRTFVRMSLGGVRDEAEIRGHRRTYVGAMPGRIIQSLINAKTKNPLFLLDEIDKMNSDFRGDPASAMLEVLDPEQNNTFQDHYLDLPMDLSKVFWLVTANDASRIPQPLYDRMEIIYLSSYTQEEKIAIASKYLIPKKLKEHGIQDGQLNFTGNVLVKIITEYTKEAGVRSLERTIAKICRKAARAIAKEPEKVINISSTNLHKYLGNPLFKRSNKITNHQPGMVNGLAWTSLGGEVLNIEVVCSPGKGELLLTGQLGDVMVESAKAAHSYLRANSKKLNLPKDFPGKIDIHVHFPAGAIPKDGPSAGVTMVIALMSALTHQLVPQTIAMTGEISLMGRVLPVGGIKEKVLAAHRYGVKKVFLPKANERDLDEIPVQIRKQMRFEGVENVETVIKQIFEFGGEA